MAIVPYTPWHKIVTLRPDLKSSELSLAVFAADLYDVTAQKGLRPVYEDPARFFALTYPTYNLRELAKDVVLRLAGKNDKAVRQLELTYGGGKTIPLPGRWIFPPRKLSNCACPSRLLHPQFRRSFLRLLPLEHWLPPQTCVRMNFRTLRTRWANWEMPLSALS